MNKKTDFKERLKHLLTRYLFYVAMIGFALYCFIVWPAVNANLIPHYWINISALILIPIFIAFYISYFYCKETNKKGDEKLSNNEEKKIL